MKKLPLLLFILALSALDVRTIEAQIRTVETFAGRAGGPGSRDGGPGEVHLNYPQGMVRASDGTLYVADRLNHTIRRVAIDGTVTTVAGMAGQPGFTNARGSQARFYYPSAIAIDSAGAVYVSDWSSWIRRISTDGTVANFSHVSAQGMVVGVDGLLYVTSGPAIYRIASTGEVTLYAGATAPGYKNGALLEARFSDLCGIATDGAGTLFVADRGNRCIRRISTAGVSTYAGNPPYSGFNDGPAASATFQAPRAVAVRSDGTVFVGDDQFALRMISPTAYVSTVNGWSVPTDLDGAVGSTSFQAVAGLACDDDGGLLVLEENSSKIRKLLNGRLSTVVGISSPAYRVDGPRLSARFYFPGGLGADASGNLYVCDRYNHAIRRIDTAGQVSTLTTVTGEPRAIVTTQAGGAFFAVDHAIERVDANGALSPYAGSRTQPGFEDGIVSAARFNRPTGIARDAAGNLFVADNDNHRIRKIDTAGNVTTIAGNGEAGHADGVGSGARFNHPADLAFTADGTLLVADNANGAIRAISQQGVVTTIAGGSHLGRRDGPVGTASLQSPGSIAVSADGIVFFCDGPTVRQMTTDGMVSTIAGDNAVANEEGSGDRVSLSPGGIAVVGTRVYVSDREFRIAVLSPAIDTTAVVSGTSPQVNEAIQLSTSSGTATSWSWSVIRRPGASSGAIVNPSSSTASFTPDVPDLFTLQLRAESPSGVRYSTVEVFASSECGAVPISISYGGSQTLCSGNSNAGTATATVAPNEFALVQWGYRRASGDTITPIDGAHGYSWVINGSQLGGSGRRWLVATTSRCGVTTVSNEIELIVNESPQARIAAPGSILSNTSAQASVPDPTPGAAYSWSGEYLTFPSATNTSTVTFVPFGWTAKIAVSASLNGCLASETRTLNLSRRTTALEVSWPEAPYYSGDILTLPIRVTSPSGGTPAGNVVVRVDGVSSGSFWLDGGRTQWSSSNLTVGPHTISVFYLGDVDYYASDTSRSFNVAQSSFGAPRGVKATVAAGSSVQVTWWPVKDAFLYEVLRLENGQWLSRGIVQGLEFSESVVSGQIYAYTVRALKMDETTSANGVPDLVGTFGFTDETLVPGGTWIKLAHLAELRSAANRLRALASLTPFAWTDATPSIIRRTHVVELRAAVAAARAAIGASPVAFSDDPLATQGVIRAVHFQELRDAVR